MNSDLEHLIVLQAQDLDLVRLRTQMADAPRRVKAAEAALQTANQALSSVQASLASEEKLRRGHESDAATQRTKIDRLRRSLDAATSSAQVEAFEREISFGQAAIAKLEDDELASMERTETLEAESKRAAALAAQRTEELASTRRDATRTVGESLAEIAGIEKQRLELRPQVSEPVLVAYDRLSKTKGTALAEALGNATQGKCSACQMTVRPQRWQDLIGRDHDDEIFHCESCGRMLFWDPRRDTPKPWEAGDRLRRALAGGGR